ncbi:MAG: hypothetical protein GXO36_02580 [Chloroflexi bacterium]|nr:hypothetical protein [Chloroflexota bacterium]
MSSDRTDRAPLGVLMLGAVLGALVGAWIARELWLQNQAGRPLNARQGLRIAWVVLKAMRQLTNLG